MPHPALTQLFESDAAALRDFWTVYVAVQDDFRRVSMDALRAHPHFGPLIAHTPQAEMDRQNAESLEHMRKGCLEGNWEPYLENLAMQGRLYAEMRIPFSAWYDVIRLVHVVLTPALVKAYGAEPDRLSRVLRATSTVFDTAMALLGERYVQAKEDDRFRLLVAAVRDYAIFMLDAEGRVQTWNQGAEALLGWAPAEILGKPLATFYPEEERDARPKQEIETATKTGRYTEEGWRVRKDGSRFWAEVVLTAIQDGRGALTGFAKVTRDLTERRQAEMALRASEQNLELTLLSIGDGVIATDAQARVVRLNPVAEALTGWKLAEARGRPFAEVFRIVHETTGQPAADPVARVLREGVVVGLANHTSLIAKDGSARPIADSAAPIRDATGSLTGVVLVFRDMTRERDAERAIRSSTTTSRGAWRSARTSSASRRSSRPSAGSRGASPTTSTTSCRSS